MKAILLIVDGLGAAWVGAYGTDWVATPHLDRLAAESVVFDQHFAAHPDAEGAAFAWHTGCHRFPHPDRPPATVERPDLIAHLTAEGGRFVHASEPLGSELDAFVRASKGVLCVSIARCVPPWAISADILGVNEEEVDPFAPWPGPPAGPLPADPAEADRAFERLQHTFAAVVTTFDEWLGRFRERLAESGLGDECLLMVTSGRGQALGEHGIVGPWRPWLHEEIVHVPLIVRFPDGREAGRRVDALTQTIDVLPTVLDYLGVSVPPDAHGHSLLPLCRGEGTGRPYVCMGLQVESAVEWALRTPAWAFLLPVRPDAADGSRQPQLYVKPDDRWEVNDLRQHHQEWAEQLEQVLHAYADAADRPGPLAPPPLGERGASAP